jgi:hypothetical protein
MTRGQQWMSWLTLWDDEMEMNEALLKLEAHEKECLLRYENIQRQLDEHNTRFDKLDAAITRQTYATMTVIPIALAIVEFLR